MGSRAAYVVLENGCFLLLSIVGIVFLYAISPLRLRDGSEWIDTYVLRAKCVFVNLEGETRDHRIRREP